MMEETLKARVRCDCASRSARTIVLRDLSQATLDVSVQEEASRDHYIVRSGTIPGTPFLGEYMRRIDGHTTYDGVEMRADTLSVHEHILRYRERRRDRQVLGFAGLGNTTMNPRFMVYVGGRLCYTREDLSIVDSAFYDPQPSVLVWQNGATSSANVQFKLAPGLEPSHIIQQDRKWLAETDVIPGCPGEFVAWVDGEQTSREKIHCVIQGPSLVHQGSARTQEEIVEMARKGWFYDLRHVIRFPYLRLRPPGDGPKAVPPLGLDVGLETMWDESKMQPHQVRRALQGDPIEIPLQPYLDQKPRYVKTYGSPVGADLIRKTLREQSYVESRELTQRNQFCIDGQNLIIRFGEGVYNHSLLGLTQDNALMWIGITGLGGRVGLTMAETAELALQRGMHHALLIDNGGDVMLNLGGEWIVRSGHDRSRIRGLLVFAGETSPLKVEERFFLPQLF